MSAKYKGHTREHGGFSSARRLFSLIAALLLLAGSVLVMYPDLLHKTEQEEETSSNPLAVLWSQRQKLDDSITKLYNNENLQIQKDSIGFENFPLYGSASFYGVKDVLDDAALHAYIKGDSDQAPDVGKLIKNIYTNPKLAPVAAEGEVSKVFTQRIYDLLLISLLSIPFYMILRALFYNAIYDWISDGIFLVNLPFRGIATVACGVTGTCLSWLIYNTVLFDKLLNKLINWINGLSVSEAAEAVSRLPSALAVNASHIIVIVILIALILAMIKLTVFRGSIVMSVFLGIFRSLIFVIAFAFINSFIGDWTWRVVLFGAIAVVAAGLIERLFDK